MTFFFTPRMGSGAAATPTPPGGWYPRSEPIEVISWPKLKRVRVKKRKLDDEPEEIEVEELPSEVEEAIEALEESKRESAFKAYQTAILGELRSILRELESAQIEEQRLIELWRRTEEEELILMMLLM